jgi:DNA-binding transcriptional ArsR family regulator
VVATRSCDDAGLRDFSQKQVSERTAGFERAGMLKQFEFEDQRDGIEAEVAAVRLEDGRAANVPPDSFFRCDDLFASDLRIGHSSYLAELRVRPAVPDMKRSVFLVRFPMVLYLGSWLIVYMNLEPAFAALSSTRRLHVLAWLKNPREHFPPQVYGDLVKDGVCGVFIARKMRVSQPTASEHLRILQQAGLVRAKRIKQWTFYRRDEARIRRIKKIISATI